MITLKDSGNSVAIYDKSKQVEILRFQAIMGEEDISHFKISNEKFIISQPLGDAISFRAHNSCAFFLSHFRFKPLIGKDKFKVEQQMKIMRKGASIPAQFNCLFLIKTLSFAYTFGQNASRDTIYPN